MKRRLLFLALPLVLAALAFGVKWRGDHPTPTKEDLEIRALMMQAGSVDVLRFRSPTGSSRTYRARLTKAESNLLAKNFFLSQPDTMDKLIVSGSNNISVQFLLTKPKKDGVSGVFVGLDVDRRAGIVGFGNFTNKVLHPVTAKRWLELLLANPRIGPELRKHLTP